MRKRPIWFGGVDRSCDSMDMFHQWLGPKRSAKIELAVDRLKVELSGERLSEGSAWN